MILECWEAQDGSELKVFPSDSPQRDFYTRDVDGRPMLPRYSIRAETWDDAMQAHYDIQRWGKYHPF